MALYWSSLALYGSCIGPRSPSMGPLWVLYGPGRIDWGHTDGAGIAKPRCEPHVDCFVK